MGRRADVEVLRTAPEEEVAHTAADEVRDVLVLMETVEDFERVCIDLASRDRMLGSRDDNRLHGKAL